MTAYTDIEWLQHHKNIRVSSIIITI